MVKYIEPKAEIVKILNKESIYKMIEEAGRACYQSSHKVTDDSAPRFIKMIIKRGHESVLEHIQITARVIGSRTWSHQQVRQRLSAKEVDEECVVDEQTTPGAFSQESQRYCNYSSDKFDKHIQVINSDGYIAEETKLTDDQKLVLSNEIDRCAIFVEKSYMFMTEEYKIPPEIAREVLLNATKTDVVMTYNLRQWRYVLGLRADKHADNQMRFLMKQLLKQFYDYLPEVFEDVYDKIKEQGGL